MKRAISSILLTISLLSLSGCRVNWFDRHYDVPWYFIAIPVAIIFIVAHIIIMSGTYVCSECGTEFKPKWYQISAYIHFMGKRLLKCPNCKTKDFFKRK